MNSSMSTLACNQPSLCIPFAHGNISKARVRKALEEECGLGEIDSIDEVSRVQDKGKMAGKRTKRFFVHFKKWNDGWEEERERLMKSRDEKLKVVYEDPWFWNITAADPKHKGGFTKDNFDGFKEKPKTAFVERNSKTEDRDE